MTSLPELVALLYRADWTRLSISAELVERRDMHLSAQVAERITADLRRASGGIWPPIPLRDHLRLLTGGHPSGTPPAGPRWTQTRQRILLAPGGRYRVAAADQPADLTFCDGTSCWVMRDGTADRYSAEPPPTPVPDLMRPPWLLSRFRLADAGLAEVAGRVAHRLVATPRLPADRVVAELFVARAHSLLERIDLLVDADTGIVLRHEAVFDGQPLWITELRDFVADPPEARDPAWFRPPASVPDEDCGGITEYYRDQKATQFDPDGAGAREVGAGGVAAMAAAGTVRLAARAVARPEPRRDAAPDPDAAVPEDEPDHDGPDRDEREPVSAALLNLIAGTSRPPLTLTAELHHWMDRTAVQRAQVGTVYAGPELQEYLLAGFDGAGEGAGWSQLLLRTGHWAARIQVARPDRYRIDYRIDDRPRWPLVVACDGDRLRKQYHNRIVSSPPRPPEPKLVRLLDPAWLLQNWRLSASGPTAAAGRPGYGVIAEPPEWVSRSRPDGTAWRIALIIDAELGIVLRQVSYLDGRPAVRLELRDVTAASRAGDFGLTAEPGLPVIESDGSPLHDLDLPAPVQAAGTAATALLHGVAAATSWLERRFSR
jgi:hypothetical protein